MKTKTIDFLDIKSEIFKEIEKDTILTGDVKFNGIDILKYVFEMGTSIYKSFEKKPMFLYSTGKTRCTLANENDTNDIKIISESDFGKVFKVSNMFNFPNNLLVDYTYRKSGILYQEMYIYKFLDKTMDAVLKVMNKHEALIMRYQRYDGTYMTIKNLTPDE